MTRLSFALLKSSLAFAAVLILVTHAAIAQLSVYEKIDSLIASDTVTPFNGVVMIASKDYIIFERNMGYADLEKKTPLELEDQFILGSISKQFTAVLVLREYDKGRLQLNDPIKKYLPELRQSWADSVTIHQLLNHTSGIVDTTQPLAFRPGSRFSYSPVLTYSLLGKIVERTSGKSYAALAKSLMKQCKMNNSTTPTQYQNGWLVNSYKKDNELTKPKFTLQEIQSATPGAAIITTAEDLIRWNESLHGGKLLKPATYKLMTTGSSERTHPVWGEVDYGYGIQISKVNGKTELGHSGYFEGFNSINFFYPESNTSVIVLSNIDWHPDDFTKTFQFHTAVKKILLEEVK